MKLRASAVLVMNAEDMIEIRGKSIKEVYKKLWLPYLDEGMDHWPEYDIQADGACSSCQGLLSFTMERLKAIGEYDENAGYYDLLRS